MKVKIIGKNSKRLEIKVKDLGFELEDKNPDIIISYGGDGTLLSSERKHPGIPKLPVRNPLAWEKCPEHKEEMLLKALLQNQLTLKEYEKLETSIENQTITALNDFVIRNKEAVHAIRFKVSSLPNQLIIGDGIVLSTPLGSSGYFKSVTKQTFSSGFGLAFNNTTEAIKPHFFKESEVVKFKLYRGHGGLTYDNSHNHYTVKEEAEITFKLSDQKAKIYEAKSLRCPNCHIIPT